MFSGFFCFLLQLALIDAISLISFNFDLFSFEFFFGSENCKFFHFFVNFISTATTYFILTMNLHAISTTNLALNLSYVIQCKEEEQSGVLRNSTYDSLVRTLTIDYSLGSRWKTRIKILIPNLIVWLIAIFISFPSFFISIITIGDSSCTPKRFTYDTTSILGLSEITMISIKTFIPVFLILITLFLVFFKMRQIKFLDEELIDENLKVILRISFLMSLIFLTFQSPKLFYDAIKIFLGDLNLNSIKYSLCMLYYFGILMRLIVCKKSLK